MEQKLTRQKKGKNMLEWALLRERRCVKGMEVKRHHTFREEQVTRHGWRREKTWKVQEARPKRQVGLDTQKMLGFYPVDRGSQWKMLNRKRTQLDPCFRMIIPSHNREG